MKNKLLTHQVAVKELSTKRPRNFKPSLDPEAPGLDEMTRRRRRVLAELEAMSPAEFFQVLVHAGIYTKNGKLTKHYRSDEPSAYRRD